MKESIKNNTLLFDFSLEGKLEITGEKKIEFLNGIVTNDIAKTKENNGCYAFFLNKFGKILSDSIVYNLKGSLLININILGKKNILQKLNQEAPLAKCVVEDVSMGFGLFHILGENAIHLIEKLTNQEIKLENEYQLIKTKIEIDNQEIEVKITKNPRANNEGFDIFIPAKNYVDIKKAILEIGKEYRIKQSTNEIFEQLRIQSKKPLFGIDFNENNILPEITRRGIDYDKGCYVGQEIVVRVKNRAKGLTAKKLFYLEIDSNNVPQKNQKIMKGDTEAGYITSAAFSEKKQKTIALGFLKKDFFEENNLTIQNANITEVQALQ